MQMAYIATTGIDVFDASAESYNDIAVLRGLGAGDTAIGGAGADRFSASGSGAYEFGGDGNDLFFEALNNHPGGARDTIDGGTGHDSLDIIISTYQLTSAVKAELAGLKAYLDAGVAGAHFVSDILHVDMSNVEAATVRLDGVEHSLNYLAQPVVANSIFATTGDVTLDSNNFTVGPDSLSLNSASIAVAALDTFLGLAAGAIEAAGTGPTDGSAAKASVSLAAGDTVSLTGSSMPATTRRSTIPPMRCSGPRSSSSRT